MATYFTSPTPASSNDGFTLTWNTNGPTFASSGLSGIKLELTPSGGGSTYGYFTNGNGT